MKHKKNMIYIVILGFFIIGLTSLPIRAYDACMDMDPEMEKKGVELPEYSIRRLLQVALQPMGKTMYIWGGGWNEADTAAGIEAVTLGPSGQWADFFQRQNSSYNFNHTRYQIHNGLDCSGYLGWTIYNFLHTINGEEGQGYVMKAKKMAENFAQRGWGTYRPASQVKDYKAGDIMSGNGHVFLVLGPCSDGSIVLAHSSPPGVQINGTVAANGSQNSEASRLANYYMEKYYPKWYAKFKPEVKDRSYLTSYQQMRWKTQPNFWMTDKEGLQDMTAQEVLVRILGE